MRQLPGEYLLARIKKERLPIPWSHSGRERPQPRGAHGMQPGVWDAVSQYVDFEPVLATPNWMHDDALINQAVEATAAELRAAGLDL